MYRHALALGLVVLVSAAVTYALEAPHGVPLWRGALGAVLILLALAAANKASL